MAVDPGSGQKPQPKPKPAKGGVGYLTDKPAFAPAKKPSFKDAPAKSPPPPTHDPQQQIPILKAHGFLGGIDSFNQRVQKVSDAYQAQHGRRPSPGLVFDVARSPHVIDDYITPGMFDVATTPFRAVMRAESTRAQMDGKTMSERPDGMYQMDNHYKMLVPLMDHPPSVYPDYKSFYAAKQGKYSMVEMGLIPNVQFSIQDVWKAAAQSTDPQAEAKYGKMSLQEAERVVKSSTALASTDVAAAKWMKEHPGQLYSGSQVVADEAGVRSYAKSVMTIGEVQGVLAKTAPWKFGTLAQTGYMTPDWIRAYSSWSRTDDFGMQSLKYYAKQNSFPQTAKGVAQMNEAFKYKIHLMNDPKNIEQLKVIQAIPLRIISDMNWKYGVPHDPVQMMKNVWAYMDTGNSSNPVVGTLQDAFHGLKLGLATTTGYYTQAKADTLALTSIANMVIDNTMSGKHLTRDDAAKLIVEKLKENPTWAKILSGGKLTDKNMPGWAKVLDDTGSFAIDLFLGAKFTNPAFKALPLTKDAAETSVAAGAYTRLAHNALIHGDLRQAVRDLHGGPVAERFASAAMPFVRAGKMDYKTFHSHVADLYGNFRTEIRVHPDVKGKAKAVAPEPPPKLPEPTPSAATDVLSGSFRKGGPTVRDMLDDVGRGTHVEEKAQVPVGEIPKAEPKPIVIEGAGILGKLAHPHMRNMGRTGLASRQVLRGVSRIADEMERNFLNLRGVGFVGPLHNAEKMIRGARSVAGYAIPQGSKELFADSFPQNLHTFLVGKGVMSRDEATLLVNNFIRARAKNNVGMLDKIVTEARTLYREKYPLEAGKQDPSIFEPAIETEQLSRFNFPSGGGLKPYEVSKETKESISTAGDSIGVPAPAIEFATSAVTAGKRMLKEPVGGSIQLAEAVNTLFNKIGHVWRTIILTKNIGRFWKHATRDPIAAFLGGYRPLVSDAVKMSAAEARNYMDENPALFRRFSTARGRSTLSELHWLSGDYWVDGQKAWNMKDYYNKMVPSAEQSTRLAGAATYVRKMMTSDAYDAYMRTVDKSQLEPLVDAILKNPGIKNAFWQRTNMLNKFRGDLEGLVGQDINLKQLTLDENFAGKEKLGATQMDEAHQYALKLFNKYFALEKAVVESGGNMDDLWRIFHTDPGLADSAAAKYLKKFQVPVQVHDGTMVIRNGWDQISENIIKAYMKPNFLSRGKLFDHTFNSLFHDYRQAGASVPDAAEAAMHTAEQVTVKHMLDFTNQLQFEQKFRWAIPFFTKHRLYVGWLINIARQYPLLGLPLADIENHIDKGGNINFNVFGMGLKVNLLRQMWLNTEDQPATVPAFKLVPGMEQFGGSWFGGTGQVLFGDIKTKTPPVIYKIFGAHTYEQATAGMDAAATRQMDKLFVSYGIQWQDAHPGVPVPEASAVKYALIKYAYQTATNDMMPTPVTFQSPQLPSEIQNLSDQYTKLYSQDPGKAAKFLDDNPRVGLAFGVYKDTNVFWHNQAMFGKLREINAKRDSVEGPLVDKLLRTGSLTDADLQAMRAAKKQYGQDYQNLLVFDAQQWQHTDVPGFPPGVVKRFSDGKLHVTTSGPFGVGASLSDGAQKLDDWMLKQGLKPSELLKVWGEEQDQAQATLDSLTLAKAGGDPDTLKKMRAGLQSFLAPYRDLPKDPAGRVVSAYFTAREKWYNQATVLRAELKTSSGSRKGEIQDQLRLLDAQSIIDSSFKYGGKTYKGPPFAVSSYNDQTPPLKVTWFLKNLVNASFENLSSTDKMILGVGNQDPVMDAAWVAYHTMARAYADGQRSDYKGPVKGYKQYYAGVINQRMTAAGHPGFMQDWLNSTKPKFQLVQQYKPLQESRYKDSWNGLLTIASLFYSKHSTWKESQRVENWQYHFAPQILAAVANEPKGFQDELAVAGGQKFIWSLMSSANSVTP